MTLANGTRVGKVQVVGGIKCGEFSEVYVVSFVDRPKRFAALKIYLPNDKTTPKDFCREIANARTVHKIIPDGSPAVLAADEKAERPWFAMSLGEPLLGPCPMNRAVDIILRLIKLCIRLRDAGFFLGDIKEDNLCFIGKRLCVIDFADLVSVTNANTHRIRTGSDYYVADEVTFDRRFGEPAVIRSIMATFVRIAPEKIPTPYAESCARGYVPFSEQRFQTLEELYRAVGGAKDRYRRRIWLGAGVWKTRIVAHKTAITVGTIAAIILIIVYIDFRDSRKRHRERSQPRIDVKTLVGDGYIAYRIGDMKTARDKFEAAMTSPGFRIEDYSYFDFMGFYKDACEKTENNTLPRASINAATKHID